MRSREYFEKQLERLLVDDASLKRFSVRIPLSNDEIAHVASALATNTHLEKFTVESPVHDEGIAVLMDGLQRSCPLQELYLLSSRMSHLGATHVAQLLAQSSQMRTLRIELNYIGLEGAMELVKALKSNTSLQVLSLSVTNIGEEGTSNLARVLEKHPALVVLRITNNSIGNGVMDLVALLREKRSPPLEALTLDKNDISPEALSALSRVLGANTSLKKLSLQSCNINAEGALELAKALETSALQSLRLSDNHLQSDGLACLAHALSKGNSHLSHLHVAMNGFDEYVGAMHLVEMLQQNTTLRSLEMDVPRTNQSDFLRALARVVETNTTLERLHIQTGEHIRHFVDAGLLGAAVSKNVSLTDVGVNLIIQAKRQAVNAFFEPLTEKNFTLVQMTCLGGYAETMARKLITRNQRHVQFRKSAMAWMWVAKQLALPKDIGVLIGRIIWRMRLD